MCTVRMCVSSDDGLCCTQCWTCLRAFNLKNQFSDTRGVNDESLSDMWSLAMSIWITWARACWPPFMIALCRENTTLSYRYLRSFRCVTRWLCIGYTNNSQMKLPNHAYHGKWTNFRHRSNLRTCGTWYCHTYCTILARNIMQITPCTTSKG